MADSRGMKRPSTASTTHSQEKRPRQGTFDGAWNSRDSGLLVDKKEQSSPINETRANSVWSISSSEPLADKLLGFADEELECVQCEVSFAKVRSLVNHILQYHKEGISYECGSCDTEFWAKRQFNDHFKQKYSQCQRAHPKTTLLLESQCSACTYQVSIKRRDLYLIHYLRSHRGYALEGLENSSFDNVFLQEFRGRRTCDTFLQEIPERFASADNQETGEHQSSPTTPHTELYQSNSVQDSLPDLNMESTKELHALRMLKMKEEWVDVSVVKAWFTRMVDVDSIYDDGKCFVLCFKDPDHASIAIAQSGKSFGKAADPIRIERSEKRNESNSALNQVTNHYKQDRNRERTPGHFASNEPCHELERLYTAWIGNLQYCVTKQDLCKLFPTYVERETVIPKDFRGQSKGFGFVSFLSEKERSLACKKKDGEILMGKPIKVEIKNMRLQLPVVSLSLGSLHGLI